MNSGMNEIDRETGSFILGGSHLHVRDMWCERAMIGCFQHEAGVHNLRSVRAPFQAQGATTTIGPRSSLQNAGEQPIPRFESIASAAVQQISSNTRAMGNTSGVAANACATGV